MSSINRILSRNNTVRKSTGRVLLSPSSLALPSVSSSSSSSFVRYQSTTPSSSSASGSGNGKNNTDLYSNPSNPHNNIVIPPPSIIDGGAAVRIRKGPQKLTSLDANPYAWPETERIAKQAPLWMLYEAEREESILSKQDQEKEKLKLQDQSRVRLPIPLYDTEGRLFATGGRKTSTARVAIKRGDGKFTVNGRPLASYFPRLTLRQAVIQPFVVTQSCGAFDISATVEGGGSSGQAGAVRHAVARALAEFDPQLKPILRYFKLLQRDPRMVERKKPGQKKARKKFQWVKR